MTTMSDFFQHQQDARRRTRLFVALFILAVVFVTAVIALTTAYILPFVFSDFFDGFFDDFGMDSIASAGYTDNLGSDTLPLYWGNLLLSFICVPLLILGGSWHRTRSLRNGAQSFIADLGGQRIGTAKNLQERQLLNVVEEIALASGVPVPPVYILSGEASINAFVIGFSHADAALCVTEGAALVLTRQEMQGLVAHEFSHILNGDMRLNTYMAGILFGIECAYIAGAFILGVEVLTQEREKQSEDMQRLRGAMGEGGISDSMVAEMMKQNLGHETVSRVFAISAESERRRKAYDKRIGNPQKPAFAQQSSLDETDVVHGMGSFGGGFLALGVVLLLTGYLGKVLAGAIRAAVCRQREYLADASAVQFTRDPEGIGNVLRKICGYSYHSYITNPGSSAINHMLFAADKSSSGALAFLNPATHPPLKDRIRKILPLWDGTFLPVDLQELAEVAKRRTAKTPTAAGEEDRDKARSLAVAAVLGTRIVMDDTVAAAGQILHKHSAAGAAVYTPPELHDAPQSWYACAQSNDYACCIALALLISADGEIQTAQRKRIAQESMNWKARCEHLLQNQSMIRPNHRLPLLNIALPRLPQQIPADGVAAFKKLMRDLIAADKKLSLPEWCIYTLVSAQLYRIYEKKENLFPKYPEAGKLYPHMRTALSVIAHYSNQGKNVQAAFAAACAKLSLPENFAVFNENASLQQMPAALHTIAQIRPLQKPDFIEAVFTAIAHDGEISAEETELLHAVCAAIDTPPPAAQINTVQAA